MWLADSKIRDIKGIYDKVSNLEIDVEDLAEIVLKFENNIVGSIHLDMIERGYTRYCKVVGKKGSIKWTFRDNKLEFYDAISKKIIVKRYKIDQNHSYIEELKHFLHCIENRTEPLTNIYNAKETLKAIIKIKENYKNPRS